MKKLIKNMSLILIVFMLFAINSCTKDGLISNEDNMAIQKANLVDYPFVLPEVMQPFQYSVYEDDEDMLFEYIQLTLDSEEKGYFIFSLNTDSTLIHYGFISETSSYYDPNIRVYTDSIASDTNNGGGMCFAWEPVKDKTFANLKDAQSWAHENGRADGYCYSISYDKYTKTYLIIIFKWVPPSPIW